MIMALRPEEIDLNDLPSLSDLKQGDRGVIRQVKGGGPFRRRLLEMGFLPGTVVLIKKYAPLNDPIEFVLKGYHVSLRREEAQFVLVEPIVQDRPGGRQNRHRGNRFPQDSRG